MTAENLHAGAGQTVREATTLSQTALRREGASIGPKTQIKGDLQSDEDLTIEGRFSGTLVLRNNQLAIGAQGRVTGTAYANIIVVDGNIEGDLYAVERISIRKGARVQGSILSPRVSLEDGATLRGSVEMDPEAIKDAIKSQFGDLDKAAPAGETRPAVAAVGARPQGPVPVKDSGGNNAARPDEKDRKDGKPDAVAANK